MAAITEKKYVDLTGLGTFRDSLKTKLASNSASAWTVNYATNAANADIATKYKTEAGSASIADALASKVDNTKFTEKVGNLVPKTTTIAGVNLENDITKSELLTALNVVDGAQVNVIEKVSIDGVEQSINAETKTVTLDLKDYAKVSDITAVLKFKGVESTFESLNTNHPASADQVGHVWIVTEGAEYAEYVCVDTNGDTADGYKWEKLGVGVDLSGYYTKTQTESVISSAVKTAKGEIETAYKGADTALESKLQGNIDALYKVAGDSATGVIATRISAVETKATSNASAIATLNGADTVEGSVAKAIKDKIANLDSTSSAGTANGGYILSVTQTDGKVAVETASFAGDVATAGNNAVTGSAVSTYVTTQIGALDVDDIGGAGKFISVVGETAGKIHATPIAFATAVNATTTADTNKVAPTEHAVRTAIDNAYNMISAVTESEIKGLFA